MAALTDRQRQILDFLRATIADRGYPPSLREVGLAVGLTGGSVHSQLTTLEKLGYIVRDPGRPRALTIVDQVDRAAPDPAPAGVVDLANQILDLHKPWYAGVDEIRHEYYVTVTTEELADLPADHVCSVGNAGSPFDAGCYPEGDEHSVPACAECRQVTEDAEPGVLYWPCPTAQLALAAGGTDPS